MTKERLVEAINAFDTDGRGLERVVAAAKSRELVCSFPGYCLLAVAWGSEDVRVSVSSDSLSTYSREDDRWLKSTHHTYFDVVTWFDWHSSNVEAATDVLRILEEE